MADSYFQQKTTTGYTEARYRYRDYLNRYPGAPRRDYARYQFALCYDKEHEKPDRDQTATREAIEQYRVADPRVPGLGLRGAARERIRQLTDLLAEHDFGIGYFYLRKGSTAAALSRFTSLEQRFPDYGGQGQALSTTRRSPSTGWAARTRPAATIQKVVEEFPESDYAEEGAAPRPGAKPPAKPPAAAAAVDTKPENQ